MNAAADALIAQVVRKRNDVVENELDLLDLISIQKQKPKVKVNAKAAKKPHWKKVPFNPSILSIPAHENSYAQAAT